MTRFVTTAAGRTCAAVLMTCAFSAAAATLCATPASAGMDEASLGYRFGTSLTQFKNMKLPFKDLPKGATVKCADDPALENRMVGYVARDEQRYESVGILTCRVVAPDPANLSWWRPVEFEINGVKSRLRFDFMEVAERGSADEEADVSQASFDDTGFSGALYGGNDLTDSGGKQYTLVAARVSPVRAKDGYKLMAGLNERLGDSAVKRDRVEIAPGIAFKMDVPTWQRGNVTVAAWDPTELGHYDLVFTMTSAKDSMQARLADIE
ncbi:hypothetical protein [Dongia rigui]|uniref:DUF3108 domain-containing protein n=1 Tax=Dongia rigui TaxID=940149 RepID=A0ABU5DZK9_9PROT|nr:hypothetical protein [Dongia rigui]MDY0872452.1 hypothetical protein [Dongia rigui]